MAAPSFAIVAVTRAGEIDGKCNTMPRSSGKCYLVQGMHMFMYSYEVKMMSEGNVLELRGCNGTNIATPVMSFERLTSILKPVKIVLIGTDPCYIYDSNSKEKRFGPSVRDFIVNTYYGHRLYSDIVKQALFESKRSVNLLTDVMERSLAEEQHNDFHNSIVMTVLRTNKITESFQELYQLDDAFCKAEVDVRDTGVNPNQEDSDTDIPRNNSPLLKLYEVAGHLISDEDFINDPKIHDQLSKIRQDMKDSKNIRKVNRIHVDTGMLKGISKTSEKRDKYLSIKPDDSKVAELAAAIKAACQCMSVEHIEIRDVCMPHFGFSTELPFRHLKSVAIANSVVTMNVIVDMCRPLSIDYLEVVDAPLCMFTSTFEKMFGINELIAKRMHFRHEHSPAEETLLLLRELTSEMLSGLISYDKLGRAKELYVSCVAQFVAILNCIRRQCLRHVIKAMNCFVRNTKCITQSECLDVEISDCLNEAEVANRVATKMGDLYAEISLCMPLTYDSTNFRNSSRATQHALSGNTVGDSNVRHIFSVEIIAMKEQELVEDHVEYFVSEVGIHPISCEKYVKTRVFVYTKSVQKLPTLEEVLGEEETSMVMMGQSDLELRLVKVHRTVPNSEVVGNLERYIQSNTDISNSTGIAN